MAQASAGDRSNWRSVIPLFLAGDRHRLSDRVDDPTMTARRDHHQTASLHDLTRRVLVGMTVVDQSAAPLVLGEMIDRDWLDQSIGQNSQLDKRQERRASLFDFSARVGVDFQP
jgi:hypothetical protein